MRIFRLILCIITLISVFSGCVSQRSDVSSLEEKESQGTASSKIEETSVMPESSLDFSIESSEESSETELPPEEPKEDLLPLIANHGEDLVFYGDLTKVEYGEPLARLESILDGYNKNAALVVYGLEDYKAISYNTEEMIFPASMIKAAYALYCCKEMEKGNGSLDTQMVYEKKHYEIGTGDLQYSPIGSTFDMATIIEKTMSISDNVGYLMMVDYFGREGYNQWITDLGAPSLQIKPTVWCLSANAKEWAIVWKEIYNYFKTDSEYARFLYNCCTGTAGNFATAGLEGVTYSHKQGHQRSGDWHSYSDAGIIWKDGGDYIFAILTDAPGPSTYEADFFKEVMNVVDNELFCVAKSSQQ